MFVFVVAGNDSHELAVIITARAQAREDPLESASLGPHAFVLPHRRCVLDRLKEQLETWRLVSHILSLVGRQLLLEPLPSLEQYSALF